MGFLVRNIALVLGCCLMAGCSAETFRDMADAQAGKLVREREQTTLGYTPQVEVGKTIPTAPPKHAYSKIPVSPVPPPTTEPVAFTHVTIPYRPAGPELRWKDAAAIEDIPSGAEMLQHAAPIGGPSFIGPPTEEEFYRRYELLGLIEYAVQHSRAYRDQMETLYSAALDVTLQRHLFDPAVSVTQSFNVDDHLNRNLIGGTSGNAIYGYKVNAAMTAQTTAQVSQKLPYGGNVTAQAIVGFVDALSANAENGETAQLSLQGSLPLLRGAGMVNLEGLINSERQLIYRVRAFEQYRRDFAVNIASEYFRLLTTQQNAINRRLNLLNADNLTERTEAMYDNGRISFLDVQRSLQSQLDAQTQLISSEDSYQAALDSFKLAIGMPLDERLEVVPVELDVPIPKYRESDATAMAFKYRLDLRTAADQVEDAQRGVANARNGLLPDVNLTGQITGGSFTGTPASSLDDRTLDYSAGISIGLPIDRLAERNTLRRALLSFDKSQRTYAQLKDQIAADIRDAIRAIPTAAVTEQIQQRGIELAQRRLEFSNELMRQGKASALEVVDSQTSLLNAQDQHAQAKATLYIRVLEFLRDTGTLRLDPGAGALGYAMDRDARMTATQSVK
jgi:outer membrane protein TolC